MFHAPPYTRISSMCPVVFLFIFRGRGWPNIYDPQMGEKACAFVTLKNKEDSFSLDEIRSFLEHEKIARFKFPEKVVVLDQFPTVGGGDRVDRRALARKARETDDEQGKAAGV